MINRKRIRTLISGIICVSAFIFQVNSIQVKAAEYWPDSVNVESESAMVMELETGTILYEKNADEIHYPASITKIMTALVVLENSDLDEVVTFSPDAVYKNEGDTSHIARDVNEEMTIEQCLYGMMLESANECAWAMGEHVAGDMDSFVSMMNKKADELGCTNTHFNNPNGLPDEQHYTSAHDMALISRAAFQIPKFAEICGTKKYTIPPTNKHSEPTYLNNHHNMLSYYTTRNYIYDNCLGGKTGYTVDAGSTLVTYAKKDGMTLVCVVMKVKSPGQYLDTRNLFDYCFDNFSIYNVSEHASISDTDISKTGKLSESIDLIKIDKSGIVVLPKTASFLDAESRVESYSDPDDSSVVGKIQYTYAGKNVGGADLVFSRIDNISFPFDNLPVEKGGSGKQYVQVDYLKIALVIVAIVLVIMLILFIRSKETEILKIRHRISMRHPKKIKSDLPTINRQIGKKRKRRR